VVFLYKLPYLRSHVCPIKSHRKKLTLTGLVTVASHDLVRVDELCTNVLSQISMMLLATEGQREVPVHVVPNGIQLAILPHDDHLDSGANMRR
jgi:hypothetical protein